MSSMSAVRSSATFGKHGTCTVNYIPPGVANPQFCPLQLR
jgi:hypothetical protein